LKLLLRCFGAAVLFLALVGALAALTFNAPLAALGWPGFLVVNSVCARFEVYAFTPGNQAPMLAAGLVVDVAIYTVVFWVVMTLRRRVRDNRAKSVRQRTNN